MAGKLEGKVAVVTGASKGIGAAIARHLAAAGASVVVNYASSKQAAEAVVAAIQSSGGKAIAVRADVSSADDISALFYITIAAFGRVDILVNNAGVYEFAKLEHITADHFHKQFDLNVLGMLLATQTAVRHFGDHGGCVINISSAISRRTPPNSAVYSGTKAAVDAMTRVLSKELASKNIRVNAINPGLIETEGVHSVGLETVDIHEWATEHTPLGRVGQVDEIAPAVVFLASDDASYITGETLYIAGGER